MPTKNSRTTPAGSASCKYKLIIFKMTAALVNNSNLWQIVISTNTYQNMSGDLNKIKLDNCVKIFQFYYYSFSENKQKKIFCRGIQISQNKKVQRE